MSSAHLDVIHDPARLTALEESGLLDSPQDEAFDRLTRLASRVLNAPVSVVSLVDAQRQFFKSQHGMSEPLASTRETPLSHSFCQYVVSSGRPLIVDDARRDPLLADNPAITENDVIAYAGVPLYDPEGHPLGSFCVMGPESRTWSEDEVQTLSELAELVMTELRLRRAVGALYTHARELEESHRTAQAAAAEIDRTAQALAEAQALAQVGSWEWEASTGRLQWSTEMCRLYAVDQGPSTLDEWEALLGEELRPGFRARFQSSGPSAEDGWESEHQVALADQRQIVVISRGEVVTNADGQVQRIRGTVQDVTAQREQEARFRAAFTGAPIGAALVGLHGADHGRWLETNRELERLLGVGSGELDGVLVWDLMTAEDAKRSAYELKRLASGEIDRTERELRLRHRDGHLVWTLCTRSLVRLRDGVPSYVITHYVDIGERKRYEAELEHLADHDPLTGLRNRRHFQRELERALAFAKRYRRPGALLALDLDGFKQVNDSAGHAAGDELLSRVASVLEHALRETDVVARLGGDEFAVLLPEVGPQDALVVADKLVLVVAANGLVGPSHPGLGVTASVGVRTWAADAPPTATELLIESDSALYAAKAAGGNNRSLHDPTAAAG